MITDEVISSARRTLLLRARSIRDAAFNNAIERQFTFEHVRKNVAAQQVGPWLAQDLGDKIAHPALYSISVENADIAEAIRSAFDVFRAEPGRGYRLSRRNPGRVGQTTLYVGGSESIRQRLRQHIGSARGGTYALNMRKWCPKLEGVVTISVQSFSPEVSRDCRQDIEDTLWDSLQGTSIFERSRSRATASAA